MRKLIKSLLENTGRTVAPVMMLILLLLNLSPATVAAQAKGANTLSKAGQQSKKAAEVFDAIMATPDQAIPKALLEKVEAVAVFTDVKRVGFLIEGLSYGHGAISRRLKDGGWSAPAYFILRGFSIGPQLKAESINIVLLFMNDKAADWLLDKKGVVFDRAKAPVGGPVGEIRTEQREVVPVADVFSYTFDDHRLVGQDLKNLLKNFALTPDNDMNKSAYRLKASELLSSAGIPATTQVPAEVNVFPQTLARYAVRP